MDPKLDLNIAPLCTPVSSFSSTRGSLPTVFKPDKEKHSTGVLSYSRIMLQSISKKLKALKIHYSQMRSNSTSSKSNAVLSFPFKVLKLYRQMT